MDIRVKQLTEAFHAALLPLFLSCALCAILAWLGIGSIALPSQPGQGQQTAPCHLCPQGQSLVPISTCILLRRQKKMDQQRPLEQGNKTARVSCSSLQASSPVEGGCQGGALYKCEELGLELRRVWRWREAEPWWAVGYPRHSRKKSYTQTLLPEFLGGGCQGGTSHPCPFQSSLSQTGHT